MDKNTEKQNDRLTELGADLTSSKNGNIYTLTIIGQVEGHQVLPDNAKTTKYEHILPLLANIEESDEIDGLLLLLNTVGGDIEAGLAIAEMVAGMKKPTVSLVLGGGHSIGVPLAVSTKKSFIVPSATMTIHPVRTNGLILGVPQSFNYLEKMQNRIIDFIVKHSNVKEEYFRELINRTDTLVNDIGSILDGYEATECGLIDEIGGVKDALAYLKSRVGHKQQPHSI